MALAAAKSVPTVVSNGIRIISQRANSSAPKVALLGAAGGIGQPLALLLKQNSSIARLALYDLKGTPGVAADLSHIDTRAQVTGHTGTNELKAALEGADVVVIPAGVPRKPGMTRDDLFNTNAGIVRDLCDAAAKTCPKALLAIITNPVNSTVPIACEVFRKNGVLDTNRIFGVTMLDILRSQTFVAELKGLDVTKTHVPVIGGHSGVTIIPLLSQTKPSCKFTEEEAKNLTTRIQDAGTEVVKAKAGAGSATLSMALAGARFVEGLVNGLKGQKNVLCAYIASDAMKGLDYFSTPVELGPNGVEKILGTGKLSAYEQSLVEKAIPELKKNITKALFSKKEEKRPKQPKSVELLGEKLLEAVENVAGELHRDDADAKKSTKRDLIAKLTEHEKETFHAATDSQVEEMLSDKNIVNILSGASKQKAIPASRAAEVRHARRGLLLLRREIFYQAKQSGYSASDARAIAERAVAAAEARSIAQHTEKETKRTTELEERIAAERAANEKEQKFYDYAFRMADKMLYPEDYRTGAAGERAEVTIQPDPKVKNIFSLDQPRLGIFNEDNLSKLKDHSLQFWADWDAHAARTWNQSFGPTNGFEEMIDLTEKGKMWPYPIDNEYLLGEEEDVGFHEHIFLERTLSQYKLPKSGPIAHFMELVCVGLSKNPYMTAEKKRSHIQW
ncbi:unnamed protein product [Toxocara canis]|nr:unnamed protein product [Toxocara canis]